MGTSFETQSQPAGATAPKLARQYDAQFQVSPEYRATLPDMQNSQSSEILGANVPIMQVGISNFKLPLLYVAEDDGRHTLETSVTGTVSLAMDRKGINMSRIMRIFYEFKDRVFSPELLEELLLRFKLDISSSRGRLKLNFNYPMPQQSLRSGLEGWQYYPVAFEGCIDDLNRYRKFIHFDFIYSSACPCSAELAEHARDQRRLFAIPHSQRSKARVSLEVRPGDYLSIEDIQRACLRALMTETQVMVKREDEQAFAEMNGAHMKFVEDAARLLHEQFDADSRVKDFQIACAHLESLHSHDAVAVINKGLPTGFSADFDDFHNLLC